MKRILLLTDNKYLSDLLINKFNYIIVNNLLYRNYKKKIQECNLIIIDDDYFKNKRKNPDKINKEEIANYLNKINHGIPIINLGSQEIKKSHKITKPLHIPTFIDLINDLLNTEVSEESGIETKYHFINCNSRFIKSKETGAKIKITEREIEVLNYLYNADKAVGKQELLQKIWGYSDNINTRAVENIIYKLRKNIKDSGMHELIKSTKEGYSIIKN